MNFKARLQPYQDRTEAARELFRAVQSHFQSPTNQQPPGRSPRPGSPPELVIGLCRGGVPLARGLAHWLGLPMDFLVVRKIARAENPELALGAVAEGAPEPASALNAELLDHAPEGTLSAARARAREELQKRIDRYRASHPRRSVAGKHVLLVDDGAATGATMRAAIESMRIGGASRVSVALPVAPEETVADLAKRADAVICPWCPAFFLSVGNHYRYFPQVSDEEVFANCTDGEGMRYPGALSAKATSPERTVAISDTS
jgi:putative phosphoribosyl transferase